MDIQKLALAFRWGLERELSCDQFAEMRRRNVGNVGDSICASHDFCDANEAMSDGEDYELLFAFSGRADIKAFRQRWRKAFPQTRLSCLGRFVALNARPADAIRLEDYRGYEHLRR